MPAAEMPPPAPLPDVPGGSLSVECSSRCGDAGDQDRLSVPLTGRSTVVQLDMTSSEVAVSSDVDLALAGRALRLAESLSWRQLALVAGVGRRDRVPLPMAPLESEPRPGQRGAPARTSPICSAGLLDPPPVQARPVATLPRLRAADLRLTRRGVLMHRLLVLDLLHDDAVTEALADMGLPRS